MNNFKQQGGTIRYTAGSDIASGAVVVAGILVGVAIADIASGAQGAVQIEGVFELPKATGGALTQGAPVIWDISDNKVIGTGAGAGDIVGFGVVLETAGSDAETVLVKLTPGAGTVQGGG